MTDIGYRAVELLVSNVRYANAILLYLRCIISKLLTMHVLIVGAGVGGLSLAQSLRKQDISFEIFERDPDADSRFQGWAIAMHSCVD
jgi:ribulose 1,5-bisphosphate synthetase/thiazole synthase